MLTLWDDFGRPNGSLGMSGNGQMWVTSGAGAPTITSGRYVASSDATAYALLDNGVAPSRMVADVVWDADETITIALISSPFVSLALNETGTLAHMFHFIASPSSWTVQVREDSGTFDEIYGEDGLTLAADGSTVHRFGIEFGDGQVTVNVDALAPVVVESARFASVVGPGLIWEPTGFGVAFERIEAWTAYALAPSFGSVGCFVTGPTA